MRTNQLWWKHAFGPVYLSAFDSQYPAARTAHEVQFLIRTLRLRPKQNILDIPCGQGRHSIEFARRKFSVTGLDFSPTLIRAARERARANGVSPRFVRGDIRALRLQQRYDAIVVLGNSFGYFSDSENERVILNLSRLLKRGSSLVLDLPNTAGMLRHLQTTRKLKIPRGHIEVTETSFDPKCLTVHLQWKIFQNGKTTILRGKLRLYTFPEMCKLLSENGLRAIKLFGSFSREPYTIESPRMIIIAQKK